MAKQKSTGTLAPEFELTNTNDETTSLSAFRGEKIVVLVLNRGFS